MNSPDPANLVIDPLSEMTRRERRNLLIASYIGGFVALTGLIPQKISSLGIEFGPASQENFRLGIAVLIGYFFFAFVIYAAADFHIWKKKRSEYFGNVAALNEAWTREDQEEYDLRRGVFPDESWYYQKWGRVAYVRIFFEFFVPLLIGLGSGLLLVLKAAP